MLFGGVEGQFLFKAALDLLVMRGLLVMEVEMLVGLVIFLVELVLKVRLIVIIVLKGTLVVFVLGIRASIDAVVEGLESGSHRGLLVHLKGLISVFLVVLGS